MLIYLDLFTFSSSVSHAHTEEILFVDTPSQQIAQEHKGTLIRCKADGDPVPKISWYFNGISVNGKLIIGHRPPEWNY